MQSCEWIPFAAAPDSDGIMVGHVATPNIEDELCPATMSYKLVTEILRGTIGFQGLIITDALEMGAITNTYGPGEAAVRAFLAGCDILLLPADLPAAFDALLQAVEDGTVSVERLDASVLRILQYKTALRAGPTA